MRENTQVRRGSHKAGYVATIIFDVIFLWIVNNLLAWGVPFLTESFEVPLWLINLSVFVSIFANALLIIYDGTWFRHLMTIAMNVFSFVAIYTVLIIFPFEFDANLWSTVARLVMIVLLIVISFATVVEFFKFVFNRD